MTNEIKPLLPFVFPFYDTNGKFLRPNQLFKSRIFSLVYLSFIFLIWYFLGYGHWGGHRCETLGEQLACASAIWPEKLFSAPHEYLLSFLTSPFFHNDWPHLKLVSIGFVVFCQSFEARAGTKPTVFIFFSSIAFTGLIMGLIMNVGYFFSPDAELFLGAMGRSWMGGSVGMMGILGALSHFSKNKSLIPIIVVLFEIWNRYENGMNIYITFGHLSSFLFGFLIWGYWLKFGKNLK